MSKNLILKSATVDQVDSIEELEVFMDQVVERLELENIQHFQIVFSTVREGMDVTYVATVTHGETRE
jgi:hypothetical protein